MDGDGRRVTAGPVCSPQQPYHGAFGDASHRPYSKDTTLFASLSASTMAGMSVSFTFIWLSLPGVVGASRCEATQAVRPGDAVVHSRQEATAGDPRRMGAYAGGAAYRSWMDGPSRSSSNKMCLRTCALVVNGGPRLSMTSVRTPCGGTRR